MFRPFYTIQQLTVEGSKGTFLHIGVTILGVTERSTDGYFEVNPPTSWRKWGKDTKTSVELQTSSSVA